MSRSTHKIIVYFSFIFAFIILANLSYSQCAMCKAAAESNLQNDPKSIARGLNKGILFLMAVPYLIVGVIFRNDIVTIIKNIKTKKSIELSKERKQWLRFALFFSTILIILFLIFLKVQFDTIR